MDKSRKRILRIILIVIGLLFIFLHITPQMAVKTHVFVMGYPRTSFASGVVKNSFYTNAHDNVYSLTQPPTEQYTGGIIKNYSVTRIGFLYFANYRGDA